MGPSPSAEQIGWAKRAADFYRRRGWNPLPSRSDRKGPDLKTYAECWTRMLDDERYRAWQSGNVQVVTGWRWRLAVIDCDGREAVRWFTDRWQEGSGYDPFTGEYAGLVGGLPWIVRSGGGGLHFWFTLPEEVLDLPSRFVWGLWDELGGADWKGAWTKGKNVELIADNKLIIAPPSIHPDTGRRYEWFDIYGPRDQMFPGIMPRWILDLPERKPPATEPGTVAGPRPGVSGKGPGVPQVASAPGQLRWDGYAWVDAAAGQPGALPGQPDEYDRDDVLDAIPNKVAVAMAWRVEFVGDYPNDEGWMRCRAVSRSAPGSRSGDEHASASFQVEKGVYMEHYDRQPISLFDLGVMTGQYRDWRECMNDLGRRYGAVPYRLSSRKRDL